MHWTYQITAVAPSPRVLARTLQLFDQQSLMIRSLVFSQDDTAILIELTVPAEAALAHRLQAKLYKLFEVEGVHLAEACPCLDLNAYSGHTESVRVSRAP